MSATVGDLPLEETSLRAAVLATASHGVDYVKLGLFPGSDAEGALQALAPLTPRIRLILVLFADALPEFDAVTLAGRIGAAGIMLDTMGKVGVLLPRPCRAGTASGFDRIVPGERACGRSCRIASVPDDVPALLALAPDLLGFRGALCRGRQAGANRSIRCGSPASGPRIPKGSAASRQANLPDLARLALC